MSIYRGRTAKEFYLASLLYDSIDDQNMCAVNSLITTKGADANIVLARKGIAPFHLAVGSECLEFALNATKLILQHDGNPNVRSDEGLTPLHIAAAWGRMEMVYLLLVSGANPELRDINKMSPLDYACEHGYFEIMDLIKSFDVDQTHVLNKDKPTYNLELEKLYIDDGKFIHKYISQPLPETQPTTLTNTLPLLPKANPEEYVRNWCSTHTTLRNDSKTTRNSDYTNTSDDCDSLGSSLQESLENEPKTLQFENVTLRGNQPKTINISPTCRKLSRESGILTLPDSTMDYTAEMENLEKQQDLERNSGESRLRNSGYFTCSSESPNAFERNIIDLTGEKIIEGTDGSIQEKSLNNARIGDGLLINSNTSSELSFVTVSEWYKYTDAEEGVTLFEKRLLKSTSSGFDESMRSALTKLSSGSSLPETVEYDVELLRKELTGLGFSPGPITDTTKRVYLKKLLQLKREPSVIQNKPANDRVYSAELEKTLNDATWNQDLTPYKTLEDVVCREFSSPDPQRHWREGKNKSSFTYLLLDPRTTKNLPNRAENLEFAEVWKTFLASIFYVGKGKRSRPYSHLYDAVRFWQNNNNSKSDAEKKTCSKKIQRILDIWSEKCGVICLHIYQNTIPAEAYTREAAIISALDINNLSNLKTGDFYGVCATWNQKQKKKLGVYLLHKALQIFLNEGERQLNPEDID